MNQVDRLEALLSRVQQNRLAPRVRPEPSLALAPVVDESRGGLGHLSPSMIPALRSPAVPDVGFTPPPSIPAPPAEARDHADHDDHDDYEMVADVVATPMSLAPPAAEEPSISIAPPAAEEPSISIAPPAAEEPSISIAPPAAAAALEGPSIDVVVSIAPPPEEPAIEVGAVEIEVAHEVFAAAPVAPSAPVIRVVSVARSTARTTFGALIGRSLAARPKAPRTT